MITRRIYLTITILMSALFFLCMFVNSMKDIHNDYEVNAYVTGTAEDYPSKVSIYIPKGEENDGDAGKTTAGAESEEASSVSSRSKVAYIGDEDGMLADVVSEWVTYTKRDIAGYRSLEAYDKAESDAKLPEMLVIDSDSIEWEKESEIDFLTECTKQGVNIVFATLPDAEVIKGNSRIRELFGIGEVVQAETTVEGIHLYSGFLLGGEMVYQAEEKEEDKYQDMELTLPWYRLASGTKVYMKGIPEDEEADTEDDYPAVIWRKSIGSAYVFAVNGGYMEGMEGLGLLTAMSSEMCPYEIYPVVNAQSIILADYPCLADENREVMEKYYNRSIRLLHQEVIWPDITKAIQDYEFGLTCLMTPQYDYSDQKLPSEDQLKGYMKNFREKSVEIGWTGSNVSDLSVQKKLAEDQQFITEAMGSYEFGSFYAGDLDERETAAALRSDMLSSVRTVVRDYDENTAAPLGYLSDHITEQYAVVNGPEYSFQKDFRARCVETALGYLSMCCDMERIAYPESSNDSWDELSKEFEKSVDAYGESFSGFAKTTASECDVRIRNFLALDYTESTRGNTVYLQTSGVEETVWFIFKSYNNSIKEIEGGSFRKLEEGVFLIEADSSELAITLESADEKYYY